MSEQATQAGFVVWFTGLSGAGKSTVARALVPRLLERGHKVELGGALRRGACGHCPRSLRRTRREGLYAQAFAGRSSQFTGVSDPYEPPLAAEMVLDTDGEPVERSVERVLACLERLGLTAAPADGLDPAPGRRPVSPASSGTGDTP